MTTENNSHAPLALTINSEEAMRDFAQLASECLEPPLLVSLVGPLGAGKTYLVRQLVSRWGTDPRDVVSPTYTLCQTYPGEPLVHHFDAYRLGSPQELVEIGSDEYFEDHAIVFVEWADRVWDVLPEDRLDIEISQSGPETRELTLRAVGTDATRQLRSIRTRIAEIG